MFDQVRTKRDSQNHSARLHCGSTVRQQQHCGVPYIHDPSVSKLTSNGCLSVAPAVHHLSNSQSRKQESIARFRHLKIKYSTLMPAFERIVVAHHTAALSTEFIYFYNRMCEMREVSMLFFYIKNVRVSIQAA